MNAHSLPIQRVAVFRALVLGDLLCATPALRALRAGLPGARITLVGLPWARGLVERLPCLDDFIEFPGWPGLPERPLADLRLLPPFLADLRSRHFDLALQMHGSGRLVNPLVSGFGARHSAGFYDEHAWRPAADAAFYAPWPKQGTEVGRMLALTDHLGMPRQGEHLDFPLRDEDRRQAASLLSGAGLVGLRHRRHGPRYAIVHPGSQLPSRRWPPGHFAAVADALAELGLTVLLTGTAAEAGLTAAVASAMYWRPIDLAGHTDLWTLGALIENAAVLVCNDTGVSHVAAALGTPSVVVSSGGDALRWAPADAARHRVFWQDMPCRPCQHAVCPSGHGCALAVQVRDVQQAALQVAAEALGG